MTKSHDVIIIGGGSAGYAAARTAQAEGANVGIVDQGPLGGLCILRGCMPTKAILRSSDLAALIRRGPEFGLYSPDLKVSLAAIIERKNRLIKEFAEDRHISFPLPSFKPDRIDYPQRHSSLPQDLWSRALPFQD